MSVRSRCITVAGDAWPSGSFNITGFISYSHLDEPRQMRVLIFADSDLLKFSYLLNF